jgi:Tfp pilus assembly protein FimT
MNPRTDIRFRPTRPPAALITPFVDLGTPDRICCPSGNIGRDSTRERLVHKQIERGFTLIEVLLVALVSIVLVAFAVPKFDSIRNSLRIAGDIRSISELTAQAKLRAASDFTRARVYADLNGNDFQLQVWNKANTCWVWDSDNTNTCLTYTSGTPSGTAISLSQGDTFGFGALSAGPTPGQATISQAAQCLDNSGSAISNTACIVFNSRGIPINTTTLAPIASGAFYVTNGTVVDGVTVSAPASIQTWSASADSSLTNWYAQ